MGITQKWGVETDPGYCNNAANEFDAYATEKYMTGRLHLLKDVYKLVKFFVRLIYNMVILIKLALFKELLGI